jgi:hypothetical protein
VTADARIRQSKVWIRSGRRRNSVWLKWPAESWAAGQLRAAVPTFFLSVPTFFPNCVPTFMLRGGLVPLRLGYNVL